jgi:hypothetical protein
MALATATSTEPREIPGQLTGYWVRSADELPRRPPHDPNGAILRARQDLNGEGFRALTLIPLQGHWRPISKAAVLTYAHTTDLADGQARVLVVFPRGKKRRVFVAEPLLEELTPDRATEVFGWQAARRARKDWPLVVLRVREIDGLRSNGR